MDPRNDFQHPVPTGRSRSPCYRPTHWCDRGDILLVSNALLSYTKSCEGLLRKRRTINQPIISHGIPTPTQLQPTPAGNKHSKLHSANFASTISHHSSSTARRISGSRFAGRPEPERPSLGRESQSSRQLPLLWEPTDARIAKVHDLRSKHLTSIPRTGNLRPVRPESALIIDLSRASKISHFSPNKHRILSGFSKIPIRPFSTTNQRFSPRMVPVRKSIQSRI
jgi:hypothetical protein